MPTTYPQLKIGAKARLAMFKQEAMLPKWVRPMTWRNVRFATLKSHTGLDEGSNRNKPIWASYHGEQFRGEKDCHDVLERSRHKGWYSDVDCDETAIGIIARLTHGRIIAGYRWTANDERVYFPEIFDDENDAAHMADEHARVFAEDQQSYDVKFHEMCELESTIEGELTRLRECIALRHKACMEYVRDEITELVESIRDNREKLATYGNM
jgi:ribosomal protein L39E